MPEPVKLRLVDLDETVKDNTEKGKLAAAVREGRRRANADLASTIKAATANALQAVKDAHSKELDRLARTVGKAAHREGALQGIVMGMALAVALAFSTWIVMREVVITNTTTQRVNYPNPPTLQEPEARLQYERNPREPGDAQRQ